MLIPKPFGDFTLLNTILVFKLLRNKRWSLFLPKYKQLFDIHTTSKQEETNYCLHIRHQTTHVCVSGVYLRLVNSPQCQT